MTDHPEPPSVPCSEERLSELLDCANNRAWVTLGELAWLVSEAREARALRLYVESLKEGHRNLKHWLEEAKRERDDLAAERLQLLGPLVEFCNCTEDDQGPAHASRNQCIRALLAEGESMLDREIGARVEAEKALAKAEAMVEELHDKLDEKAAEFSELAQRLDELEARTAAHGEAVLAHGGATRDLSLRSTHVLDQVGALASDLGNDWRGVLAELAGSREFVSEIRDSLKAADVHECYRGVRAALEHYDDRRERGAS